MKITCKRCRRLGVSVCGKARCAISRKPYPPGKAAGRGGNVRWSGAPVSDYGRQLRDKQIVKFTYGLRERQFKNYVVNSSKSRSGSALEHLVASLERRLDNVVYRLNFSNSRRTARQLVSHGHIQVNGRKVNIPSYALKLGDVVTIRPESKEKGFAKDLAALLKKYQPPGWLELDKERLSGRVIGAPSSGEFDLAKNINSVVEFYSR